MYTPEHTASNNRRISLARIVVTAIVALIAVTWLMRESGLGKTIRTQYRNSIFAAGSKAEEAKSYFDQAKGYLAEADWEKAERNFSRVIALDDTHAEAYQWRGRARRELNELGNAMLDENKAIQLNPQLAGAYRERALIKRTQDRWEEAITDLTKAVSLDDQDFEAYQALGDLYYAYHRWSEAIKAYSRAIEVRPDYLPTKELIGLYELRAVSYLNNGQIEEGVDDLDAMLTLDPSLHYDLRQFADGGLRSELSKLSPGSPAYAKLEKLLKRLDEWGY